MLNKNFVFIVCAMIFLCCWCAGTYKQFLPGSRFGEVHEKLKNMFGMKSNLKTSAEIKAMAEKMRTEKMRTQKMGTQQM